MNKDFDPRSRLPQSLREALSLQKIFHLPFRQAFELNNLMESGHRVIFEDHDPIVETEDLDLSEYSDPALDDLR